MQLSHSMLMREVEGSCKLLRMAGSKDSRRLRIRGCASIFRLLPETVTSGGSRCDYALTHYVQPDCSWSHPRDAGGDLGEEH